MKVCRTCLQVLNNDMKCLSMDTNDCSTESPSIRNKLLVCVPEMALDLQQAIICMPCSDALNAAFNFKNKCLQTETTITNYAEYSGCSRDSISITEVANFNGANINGEIHYPITEIVEDEDSDVDIKPVIYNEYSEPFIYPSENTEILEVGMKVKSENPDFRHLNNDTGYSLPKNVIFGPELDVEVRAFKRENIDDPFAEDTDCSQVNHFMEISDESTFEAKNECPYCQRCFSSVNDLDAHVTSHMENRPLKCTLCERRFVRKDKLQLHMRTHTGEKPFECTTCGRCFSRKDKLNNHIRTHTGEKPHQCILCQKSFARKDKMNMHMKSQHWLALANLEITVVKKDGLINNACETNTSENSST